MLQASCPCSCAPRLSDIAPSIVLLPTPGTIPSSAAGVQATLGLGNRTQARLAV
eukprot:CAMPEP_0177257124 /NCGR_PEP_ID=MMETSP0367-20130122/57350_1 /TAXON_ID=447022 ORGANISM="Scrippsiella hangoei-like, Strain SHHI-4" /NCGR_SAMPLE_ID=MMETSP0367 /ASSEMBLY_ACC=CAM_ASM_000362 /LENGTH=53 /DNA_ID=CAMNT_0018711139 /DNA_START=30 /DNA_END=187 /DNA_ORIENTATION=+